MRAGGASRGALVRVGPREEAARAVAGEIAALAREHDARRERFVLGLASGRSPLGVYAELARLARAGELPVERLALVALDEYLGLPAGDPRSFAAYHRRHVLEPLGIEPGRLWIPRCDVGADDLAAHLVELRARLEALGAVDLQLLGLGRNGHVAFQEPGATRASRLGRVALAPETREDAAADFGGLARAPLAGITLGLTEILSARRLRVLAFGSAKRAVVRAALEGPETPAVPASLLRGHPDLVWHLDVDAAP
jgi:glucosamine-6-phosphate deaminase